MINREDCVKIGEIVKSHSLNGNVVVFSDSDLIEKYSEEPFFIMLDGGPVPFFIEKDGVLNRNHSSYIVKFEFVDTKEQAEKLVGAEILLEKSSLNDDDVQVVDHDISELEGFLVKDTVSGADGYITEIADYSGNVLLTISILGKEILLPLSEEYIKDIDMFNSIITVSVPEDLINLN